MNRANNHIGNPPALIQGEHNGITYIFNGHYGDWSAKKNELLNPENWSVVIPIKPIIEPGYDGYKRRKAELWFDDLYGSSDIDYSSFSKAQGDWEKLWNKVQSTMVIVDDDWEAKLLESIEANRNDFTMWLGFRCDLASMVIDMSRTGAVSVFNPFGLQLKPHMQFESNFKMW